MKLNQFHWIDSYIIDQFNELNQLNQLNRWKFQFYWFYWLNEWIKFQFIHSFNCIECFESIKIECLIDSMHSIEQIWLIYMLYSIKSIQSYKFYIKFINFIWLDLNRGQKTAPIGLNRPPIDKKGSIGAIWNPPNGQFPLWGAVCGVAPNFIMGFLGFPTEISMFGKRSQAFFQSLPLSSMRRV